ncbi:HNH endonuclease [Clostridium perfringens]
MNQFKYKELESRYIYYMKNYNPIFNYVHDMGETQVIIDPIDKVCRFCGKKYPEVKFKKKAHAISEMLGNKEFVLRNECDSCNIFFGQKLEDNLGKYLGLGRTLSQIYGKEGVPSYKSRDRKSRVDFTDKGIVIQATIDSNFIERYDNYIVFHSIRDTYTPIAVYKALVKMALSLIPFEQMSLFKDTVEWLKEENHVISKHNMDNYTYVIERYVPGPKPMQLRAMGFVRKYDVLLMPYYQFILEFANYSYQIIVPCKKKDKELCGHEIDFIPIPGTHEVMCTATDRVLTELKYMGNKEKVKDEPLDICMNFEKCELYEGNEKSINEILKEEGINLSKRLK